MNSPNQTYVRGVVYAVLSGLFLSGAGLTVRYIEQADAWQVLFYRSIAFFVTVCVFIALRRRGNPIHSFIALRPVDYLVSLSLACGLIFYVLSLFNTSVANTVLMLSTGPFFAAMLGWLFLSEKVGRRTWTAMVVAVVGVAIMVSGGIGTADMLGFIFALLAVVSFAIMIVVMRAAGERDVIAATALAGLVAALISMPFMDNYVISMRDLALSSVMGSLQIGLGFILITLASRSVPAAQVPLLALTETALAPMWVWWLINEVPSTNTLIGGAVVLTAVIFQGLSVNRSGAD
ncbi:MAG: DMT family transporter [Pseudomonadota bacterium]